MVYAAWVWQDAKVLEVGAPYSQCILSDVLGLNDAADAKTTVIMTKHLTEIEAKRAGSDLVSVSADPMVWDILEANLAKYKVPTVSKSALQRSKPNT